MPFTRNNTALGSTKKTDFLTGQSDLAIGTSIENNVLLPWPSNPLSSWVYFDCAVGVMLDSGIVIHNRLPQVNNRYDTIAVANLDDQNYDSFTGFGVNLKCLDQYTDIVQRMGHSRYWFRIWGQALRVGYQVPIPGIKLIGGTPAIPYDRNPQWGYNRIAPGGNYSGVILWHAQWSLWYTTAVPPTSQTIPAADPSAHISGTTLPPKGIQAPYSQPDDNSENTVSFQGITTK